METKDTKNYCHHYDNLPFIESDLLDKCKYCLENKNIAKKSKIVRQMTKGGYNFRNNL